MNRRQFAKMAGIGTAGTAVGTIPFLPKTANTASGEEIIDIHQHVNFHARSNEELLAHQKKMGVSKTVLLPSGSALAMGSTHKGKSNGLAARVFGTFAAARLAKAHPDAFSFFCNEIPDVEGADKELEKWLEDGALGIGEQKFNLDCDSAPMIRIYEVASAYEVPVLLHFQHGMYNKGFERFHKILERFPKVNFIGHAQTWWGNIDANHEQKNLYPKTKVTPGGLTDKYLADYPNMFGDLSAGSGKNALNRDEEHAVAFLDRHQDKLMLGTDCADAVGEGDKCSGSGQIANVMKFVTDPKVRAKILSGNAKRIIKPG
ncbi:MAG: amidohydrolase [Verrucomicrobiales bacterium]|nr:amidohydrolase [Verrucomicrobiales bacterium]